MMLLDWTAIACLANLGKLMHKSLHRHGKAWGMLTTSDALSTEFTIAYLGHKNCQHIQLGRNNTRQSYEKGMEQDLDFRDGTGKWFGVRLESRAHVWRLGIKKSLLTERETGS